MLSKREAWLFLGWDADAATLDLHTAASQIPGSHRDASSSRQGIYDMINERIYSHRVQLVITYTIVCPILSN